MKHRYPRWPHPNAERPGSPTGFPEQVGRGGGNREASGGRGGRNRASGQGMAHYRGSRPRAFHEERRPGQRRASEGRPARPREGEGPGPAPARPRAGAHQGTAASIGTPARRVAASSGSPSRRLRLRSVIGHWRKEPASPKQIFNSLDTNWSMRLSNRNRQLHLLPHGESPN